MIDTEDLDLASAEQMLTASLRGWHMAAIIWVRKLAASSADLRTLRL
ncbi:hypothetical protein K8O92_22730 [Nocardia asteroides]|nr:hypothetical protein K8O92_22730 [Nocardia asteroides]